MTLPPKKYLFIAGALLLLVLIIVGSLSRSNRRGELPEIYAETVEPHNLVARVHASGVVKPEREVKVGSKVMGEILRLHVREGQAVKRGELLAEIDTRTLARERQRLAASQDAARAQAAADHSTFQNAKEQYARNLELSEKGFLSSENLDALRFQLEAAEARLRAAGARLEEAAALLARVDEEMREAKIFAPMKGVVTRIHLEEGEQAIAGTLNVPGTVILEIGDRSGLLAELKVDETDIVQVAPGQKAEIVVDALSDEVFGGSVIAIASAASREVADVSTFDVKVRFDSDDSRLSPGMSCDADIETGRREGVLAVPIGAVISAEEGKAVFVATEKDRVEQRPVKLGISDDTHIEIIEGVAEGERVASGPYKTLRELEDGDAVRTKKFRAGAAD